MKQFRQSVFRLLAVTCFLLLVAWLGMQVMQYGGDWERLYRDLWARLENSGVYGFFRDRAIPFFQREVLPRVETLIDSIRDFIAAHVKA